MDNNGRVVTLTSGEVGSLWEGYIGETMVLCVMKHFSQHVYDGNVKGILTKNTELLHARIARYQLIFEQEKMIAPAGFSEADVFLNAPLYLKEMARGSIIQYSDALFGSHRRDMREFFIQNMNEYIDIFHDTIEYLLEKGIVIRTPSIPIPSKIEFVESEAFLGKQRPITAQEIKAVYVNLDTNMLGKSLMIAFSQAAESDDLREYLVRGRQIAHKHIELFINLLTDEDLPSPQLWDPEVSESRIAPFSDKLMMYHTDIASTNGLSNYGTALSKVARKDITIDFGRLSLETAKFALDGVKISIKKGWLEQPPLAANRDFLSK